MPFFQGTAVTHTKKNLPLFQGIVDNERESGFRWLLEQVHLLLKECEADDPTLFITDYDNALMNALKYEFPQAHHQLCVFHMNMNIVLNIKKKWQKPTAPGEEEAEEEAEEETEDAEEEEAEAAIASLNSPARNKATIPTKVPELKDIPYTRQALFDLLKFMEYSTDREVYDTAWQRLQEKFKDQKAILNYLKTYYVDDEEQIVGKWAAHQTCRILNFGLRTTSSTESMHRKLKVYLGHGIGNALYLVEACHEALEDTARGFLVEEARQKTASLAKYNGLSWLGRLPFQVSWAALELLVRTRQQALQILKNKLPRRCNALSCTCPIYTQYGLICASRMADREEANLPLERADVHEVYWLDRDLSSGNPLLTVLSPKRVTATKGRPRETATFATSEEGAFTRAIMAKQTSSTTTSLGSKAGDKTRATTASVQRINSAWEHNDTTLQSLDDEDLNRRNAQGRAQKRRSGPTSSAPAALVGIPSSSRQPAKRQRTGRQTVNQLPSIDLEADDVDNIDVSNDDMGKETQGTIVCGGTDDCPIDLSSDGLSD
jgi:hypothetical protein